MKIDPVVEYLVCGVHFAIDARFNLYRAGQYQPYFIICNGKPAQNLAEAKATIFRLIGNEISDKLDSVEEILAELKTTVVTLGDTPDNLSLFEIKR
jgi:hypothetical protein